MPRRRTGAAISSRTSMFLSPEELIELTHAKRRDAQVRALRNMGIEHKVRPDGTVAVLRTHIEQIFGVIEMRGQQSRTANKPNWDAINQHEKRPKHSRHNS